MLTQQFSELELIFSDFPRVHYIILVVQSAQSKGKLDPTHETATLFLYYTMTHILFIMQKMKVDLSVCSFQGILELQTGASL